MLVIQRTPPSVAVRGNRPTDPEWIKTLGEGWQTNRRRNFISITTGNTEVADLVDDSWTAAIRAVGGMYGKPGEKIDPEASDRKGDDQRLQADEHASGTDR